VKGLTAILSGPSCNPKTCSRQSPTGTPASPRNYEQVATVTGVLLRERKRRLPHGAWLPWLAEHFDGTSETARVYMRMADVAVPEIADAPVISEPPALLPPATATPDDQPEIVDAEIVKDETHHPP
jgi:hypothetical protein